MLQRRRLKTLLMLITMTFILLALLPISLDKYSVYNDINYNSDGNLNSIIESSVSYSQFTNNPTYAIEDINVCENRSTVNGEFERFSEYCDHEDDFYGFSSNAGTDFIVNQNTTRKSEGEESLRFQFNNYGTDTTTNTIFQVVNDDNAPIHSEAFLSFDWFIESADNKNNFQDAGAVQVYLNDTRSIFYYFLGYTPSTSNMYNVKVPNHNESMSWYSMWDRNISQDYRDYFGDFTGPVGISAIQILIGEFTEIFDNIIYFVDNMSIMIDESEKLFNGGFESSTLENLKPTGWIYTDQNAGYIKSSEFTQDTKGMDKNSLNFTTNVKPPHETDRLTRCEMNFQQTIDPYRENNEVSEYRPMVLNLSYYIEDELPAEAEQYYFDYWLEFYDGSDMYWLQFFLYDTEFETRTNTSNYKYYSIDNTTGIWHNFEVDLWTLLEPLTSGDPTYLRTIYMESVLATEYNNNMTVILDDIGIITSVFSDPSFENPDPSNPQPRGWDLTDLNGEYSTESQYGTYCANFTKNAGTEGYATENYLCQFLTKEIMFSFDYYLANAIIDTLDAYYSALNFVNTTNLAVKSIIYVLGTGAATSLSNQTDEGIYIVKNLNTTDTWLDVKRNLYWDFKNVFPSEDPENYGLFAHSIYVTSQTPGKEMTILVDNYKTGTGMPEITDWDKYPENPVFTEDFNISVDLYDGGSGIQNAVLHYNLGDGWNSVEMAEIDVDEQIFNYTMPKSVYNYGDTLEYYIEYEDEINNTKTFPTNAPASPLSVFINDSTKPAINNIMMQPEVGRATRPVNISASVTDTGSGIGQVILYYSTDGGNKFNTAEMTSCGTDLYCASVGGFPENTILTYYVSAIDNEDNEIASNDLGQNQQSTIGPRFLWWELLLIGAGIASVVIVGGLITFKVTKNKKKRENEEILETVPEDELTESEIQEDNESEIIEEEQKAEITLTEIDDEKTAEKDDIGSSVDKKDVKESKPEE
ncbi:MAG: hypothetical protein GF364_02685 [Candidatus Lokiarchaeota archaeon]|nr:hypothetical protein [Candidatus Lokiarchaeota archaeon]